MRMLATYVRTAAAAGLAAALCLPGPSAQAMKKEEPNVRKMKPLPLYAAAGPTSSGEIGALVQEMVERGVTVVVYVNTHGMEHTGAPWGAGVGTCPAIMWDKSFRAKPMIIDMQTVFDAAKVTSKEAAAKDQLLIAHIAKELSTGHTVVLGWCYGAQYAGTHLAAIKKASGL
jgi:hypothetical protein